MHETVNKDATWYAVRIVPGAQKMASAIPNAPEHRVGETLLERECRNNGITIFMPSFWTVVRHQRTNKLIEKRFPLLVGYGHTAMSVPFGGGKGAKQKWIESEFDRLQRFERIFISTDHDGPGDEAADEIASRLGRHRCLRVCRPAQRIDLAFRDDDISGVRRYRLPAEQNRFAVCRGRHRLGAIFGSTCLR